jgi:hypothetical protein
MAKKSRPFQLTRAESELLIKVLDAARQNSDPKIKAGAATLENLNRKAWSAYADTHPEDGPYK